MKWIKITEDRPKVGDQFLIFIEPEIVHKLMQRGFPTTAPPGISISTTLPRCCLYWMPLPNPPNLIYELTKEAELAE